MNNSLSSWAKDLWQCSVTLSSAWTRLP